MKIKQKKRKIHEKKPNQTMLKEYDRGTRFSSMFVDEERFGEITSSMFVNKKLYYRMMYDDGKNGTISHRRVHELIESSKNVLRSHKRSKQITTDTESEESVCGKVRRKHISKKNYHNDVVELEIVYQSEQLKSNCRWIASTTNH